MTTPDVKPILQMQHVSKTFPGVKALQDVQLRSIPARCTP